jgi:hypothetical protein
MSATDQATPAVRGLGDQLAAVRELITDESRWVGHTLALDAAGVGVGPGSADAARWSLAGAVMRVGGWGATSEMDWALSCARGPGAWPAARTYLEEMAILDRAIELVESGEMPERPRLSRASLNWKRYRDHEH